MKRIYADLGLSATPARAAGRRRRSVALGVAGLRLVPAVLAVLAGPRATPARADGSPSGAALVRNVPNAEGLSTGEVDEIPIVVRPGSSLEITMAFSGAPAALAAADPVNDLDLELVGPDGVFLGNVLADGFSATGGVADHRSQVERVLLPSGTFTTGDWTIRIHGVNVPDGPQGYALHVAGEVDEVAAAGVVIRDGPATDSPPLGQNRPNPVSSDTTIRFVLPHSGELRLGVYDISGHRVRALSEGVLSGGAYSVVWDGRDEGGNEVEDGIYFYRLEAEGIDETRKMVVLR